MSSDRWSQVPCSWFLVLGCWILFLPSYLPSFLPSALDPKPLIPNQTARGVPHINLLISFGFKIEGGHWCTLFCAACTIFCAERVWPDILLTCKIVIWVESACFTVHECRFVFTAHSLRSLEAPQYHLPELRGRQRTQRLFLCGLCGFAREKNQ